MVTVFYIDYKLISFQKNINIHVHMCFHNIQWNKAWFALLELKVTKHYFDMICNFLEKSYFFIAISSKNSSLAHSFFSSYV